MEHVQIAIIGAGSAGLSALRQAKRQTDNYVLIDRTPLGTKCARTGCMPSKALIYTAGDFHRRTVFEQEGIGGAQGLSVDIPAVLRHVRSLRDYFTGRMAEVTRQLAQHRLVTGTARLSGPDRIQVNDRTITAERIVIATGSRPVVPGPWKQFGPRILTSDSLFEQTDLPRRIAVIGLGAIGLEIGQALSRLGLEVTGFDMQSSIASITDPDVNDAAIRILGREIPLHLGAAVDIRDVDGQLQINHPQAEIAADAVLAAMGTHPNLDDLGLENLGVELDEKGMPPVNLRTMQVGDLPVFLAGDANGHRPILHEALDEGFVAGMNSAADTARAYCRRSRLQLVFSDPQIAAVGAGFQQLKDTNASFAVGSADFSDQARARLELRNEGLLHVYADRDSARLLGAEMVCPAGEHLAHLLGVAVEQELTIFDLLHAPLYHPVIEESLRTALHDAADRLPGTSKPKRLSLCDSCPETPLR